MPWDDYAGCWNARRETLGHVLVETSWRIRYWLVSRQDEVMITDPRQPGYRYPRPGERFWHRPWRQRVTVIADDPGGIGQHDDTAEVTVVIDATGEPAVANLRSLERSP
jgi:hypothetical protein